MCFLQNRAAVGEFALEPLHLSPPTVPTFRRVVSAEIGSLRQSRKKHLISSPSPSATSNAVNSLAKVLFAFPSRYLFPIGHAPVFSLKEN